MSSQGLLGLGALQRLLSRRFCSKPVFLPDVAPSDKIADAFFGSSNTISLSKGVSLPLFHRGETPVPQCEQLS